MSQTPVAKKSEIAPGTTRKVTLGNTDVLLCNVEGEIYAIEDVCTHDGGELDQGELEGERIMCPRHGAYFDVRTGAALTLPAILPVPSYEVRIEGDDIYVKV
ncbi:MAG: biphenyl 2,3-dioxygenase [Candidatus Meridianibacter frigidus]|nr:MAG: biphenyl 2,3-dioxygenase [Candidatus Eremiobacteraeota bacterium]